MKAGLAIVFLAFLSTSSEAQTVKGNCNATVTGSGNDVTINCLNGNAPNGGRVKLVIAGSSTPMVLGNISWGFIDPTQSEFWVSIDDDEIVRTTMDRNFKDTRKEIDQGTHFYSVGVNFHYLNGIEADTECSGEVDAQVSAAIVPRIALSQNSANGSLASQNCGFQLR